MKWKCITPATFEQISKIKGDEKRHIEQLWDENKKIKEVLFELKQRLTIIERNIGK